MRELLRRLRFLLHRKQFEQDLEEEMQHHREMQGGDERRFGNVARLKEASRAAWSWNFLEQLSQDIRYAFRTMAANRLFTAMAVLSLALGIGANTAIYSFMDAILLRSLPVQHPEQLVVVRWYSKGHPKISVMGRMDVDKRDGSEVRSSPNYPYPVFESLRSQSSGVAALFAYAPTWQINVAAGGPAEALEGLLVSGDFYGGLGVQPAIGRLISNQDDQAGSPSVVVLTYDYWQAHFALDRGIVGQSILVNRVPFTVVGVSAPGFFGVDAGKKPALMIPMRQGPRIEREQADAERLRFFNKGFYWVEMMGRLRPGVSVRQAEAELAGKFHAYDVDAAPNTKEKDRPQLWLQEGRSGLDSLRREFSKPLLVLMTMVGLILIIACANIANLLLARATARRQEIAIRLSLGADRWRVVRQLVTESVLLSVLGGVMGLAVAYWSIQSITWLLANGIEEYVLRVNLNWQVLCFTLVLAIGTGIAFGLAPALRATRVDLPPALKEARASAFRGRFRLFGFRLGASQILVVTQIALSLLLVIGAGLFVRTLSNLHSVELGFNQNNILLFSLDAQPAGLKSASLARFYAGLKERFRAIPGVRSVSISSMPLVSGFANSNGFRVPGAAEHAGEPFGTELVGVDASFLSTMEIPILLGRGIEERDMVLGRVAVINEKLAAKYFGKENPLGRKVAIGDSKAPTNIEIVGVAKNCRYDSLETREIPPVTYVPITKDPDGLSGVFFQLKTEGDPLGAIGTVRQIVSQANSNVPVTDVSTQSSRIDRTISSQRTFASLCMCFAVLALIIACVGLYGTMAYTVERRTNEIGIRMALGARRGNVQWMVLREVLAMAVAGLLIGLVASWQTTRFVESFLFGTKANDLATIALSVAMLATAGLIAGCVPALRASRIDPMVALRNE